MANTPRLGIPLLEESQESAEVTHNSALYRMDALIQAVAKDKDLNANPGSPATGDTYIVGPAPTAAWTGQAGNLAIFYENAWNFVAAREGMLFYVDDENLYYKCTAAGPPATWASTTI